MQRNVNHIIPLRGSSGCQVLSWDLRNFVHCACRPSLVFSVVAVLWNASELYGCQILSFWSMSHAPKMHLAGFRYFVHLILASQELRNTTLCASYSLLRGRDRASCNFLLPNSVLWHASIATPHQHLKKLLYSCRFLALEFEVLWMYWVKSHKRAQRKKPDQTLGYCGAELPCSPTGQIVHWASRASP